MITSLTEAKLASLKDSPLGEMDASFEVHVNGEYWHCYTVHISHREVLCYCNEGHASFVVDSYGDNRHTIELIDWETN